MARLAVETRRGLNSCSTSRACEMEANSSFGDLSFRFIGEGDTIHKIELSSTNSNFKMRVQTTTLISVCNQFGEFSVNIFIRVPKKKWTPTRRVLPRSDVHFFSWWEMQTSEDGQTRKTRLETVLTKYTMNCWIIISPAYVPPLQGEGTKTCNKSA